MLDQKLIRENPTNVEESLSLRGKVFNINQIHDLTIKKKEIDMALKIIDDAIQAFGGAGVTTDPHLAQAYAGMRTLRLADGPDEVHRLSIARNELKKYL